MLRSTPKRRVLFAHRYALLLLAVFGVFSLVVANVRQAGVVSADTTSTVNFQARLQTASGAVVPDGYYNVEFNLYSVKENGTPLWTEDYLVHNGAGLQTINGYLSTGLGSITSFPTDIDWSQPLWLTMKVGGTADTTSPDWDSEMSPRLAMTAQPYAFQAGKAAQAAKLLNVSGGNTSTLEFQGSANGSQVFQIQDQGAAGTYHLLTDEKANTEFVQLQTGTPVAQTGNLAIDGSVMAGGIQADSIDASDAAALTIGGANATGIILDQSTTIAAGKTLTIVGNTTANRPTSPTKGMLYYDTSTNQLLQYNGTKWVGSQKTAMIVAASNSSQADKDAADYVATGSDDQNTINTALSALPSGGGTVYLEEGTYTVTGSISVPNNVTLSGAGSSTLITIPNNFNAAIDAIVNTTAGGSGQGITIRDMRLDGNESNQSSCATMEGIALTSMGYASGVTSGALVEGVESNNWCSVGFKSAASSKVDFTDTSAANNGWAGYYINGSSSIRVINSQIQNNPNYGIYLDGTLHSVVNNNTIIDNGGSTNNGVYIGSSSNNSITDNHISDTSCSSSCYAINISDNTSADNYLSDNILTGDGSYAATVNDAGTGTIYSGQMNASNGGFVFKVAGDSVDAFSVQDASGTSAFSIDTANNQVNINDVTTIANTALVKTTDAHALTVQNASGVTMLNVDSSASSISLTNTTIDGSLTVTGGGNVAYQHGTDYTTTGSQNNVDFGSGSLFRLTGTGEQIITGIAGGTDGRQITLVNAAEQAATLKNDDTTDSFAVNAIITGTGTDLSIAAGASVSLVYDSGSSVWRVVGTISGGESGGSYVSLQVTGGSMVADDGSFLIDGTGTATTLQANTFDTANAGALSLGSTNATSIDLDQDTTIAAGKSLTLTGGNTANRPTSPTKGMLYYDTSTNQLLQYNGTKWVGSQKTAMIVAASNSSQADKDAADYVATGSDDGATINTALTAAAGGTVYLEAGTYNLGSTNVSVPNNTTLAGVGAGTLLTYPSSPGSLQYYAIMNSDTSTGTGVTVRDLTIDGNKANLSGTEFSGIYFRGMGSSTRAGGTITGVTVKNMVNSGIVLVSSAGSVISGNTVNSNTSDGITLTTSLGHNTISDNTVNGNGGTGISISSSTTSSNDAISNNEISNNSSGILVLASSSTGTRITGNIISDSTAVGITISFSAGLVSGNTINDSGLYGIYLASSNSNQVTGNLITNSTDDDIEISDSASSATYLSNNTLTSIGDAGTGTIYDGQMTSSTGDFRFKVNTNSSSAFQVQDASGASAINVDTSASQITLNDATTITNTALVHTTSATAFQIQDADNNVLFTADTATGTITFGTGDNTIVFTASGGLVASGTARHTKKITLTPEYAGAVLDAQQDSACTSANTGSMTSGYANGLAGFGNTTQSYYQWTSSSATTQCYDVVVQVPVPSDFSAWASNTPITINTYSSSTSTGALSLQAIDTSGVTESSCNYVSVTPGSASTWATSGSGCTISGTYTAGGTMTVRIRLSSQSAASVRLGNVTLTYKSNL